MCRADEEDTQQWPLAPHMHANIRVWTDTHVLRHVHMQAHTVVGEHLEYIFGCNKYI